MRGVLFGALLGFLAHSGPTVVMLVGFVNAGLMTLAQSFPVVMGANLGTSLSMQAFAFRIGDYCYAAIALGFLCRMVSGGARAGKVGDALMGFGLLFLGMNLISSAVAPTKTSSPRGWPTSTARPGGGWSWAPSPPARSPSPCRAAAR
ncbi:MAG: Na/Pi symporter [Kiritimatiellia bacterium]